MQRGYARLALQVNPPRYGGIAVAGHLDGDLAITTVLADLDAKFAGTGDVEDFHGGWGPDERGYRRGLQGLPTEEVFGDCVGTLLREAAIVLIPVHGNAWNDQLRHSRPSGT